MKIYNSQATLVLQKISPLAALQRDKTAIETLPIYKDSTDVFSLDKTNEPTKKPQRVCHQVGKW